jgi:hypothetical protein
VARSTDNELAERLLLQSSDGGGNIAGELRNGKHGGGGAAEE